MVSQKSAASQNIERVYQERDDVDFREFFGRFPALDDAALAELIEADGRIRIELRLAVDLDRYLDAVPDLLSRVDPLDAAIDVTLRSMLTFGIPPADAERQLAANHPRAADAIREAGALGRAMLATSEIRSRVAASRERHLPAEFGPPMPGGQARYRLLERLGRGSGGEVFRAVDRLLSDDAHEAAVAIKVLEAGEATPWSRQRLIEEAAKARRVVHPNVVRVIDRGVSDEDEDFIVYEYIEGGDLHAWAARHERAPVRSAVRLMAGVARGVQGAHSAGLVHCDLKPGNVLVTASGEPKVADFGVAVRRDPWAAPGAEPGGERPVGNLAFISPEQYRMEPGALTPSSDLYALGGLLYWALTGRLPNGTTIAEIDRTHDPIEGRTTPPSVRAIRPGIDRDLEAVVARALAPRPQDRYQSAAQLADDLEAWLRVEPIRWTRPSTARTLRLWMRRKPAMAAAAAFLGVVLVAAATVIWTLSARAAAERVKAEVMDAELAERDARKRENKALIANYIRMLAMGPGTKSRWEVLPMLPYFDWALGTTVLGDPGDEKPPWLDRVAIIREMLDESRRDAGELAFETLCLESTLGFWLVAERRHAEAEPILAANREHWRAILAPDQQWHQSLGLVASCAAVLRLAERGMANLTGEERAELAGIEADLQRAWDVLGPGSTDTQIKSMIWRIAQDLYGPRLFNDKARLAELARR